MLLLLSHRCPECDFTSLAPLSTICAGDAGLWQCKNCNQAYRINIEFRRISAEILQQKSDEILPVDESNAMDSAVLEGADLEDADALRAEEFERRLLEIQQESDRLLQMIQDLDEEAERLQREKDDQ